VFCLAMSIVVLLILPITHYQIMKGLRFYGPLKLLFWVFVVNFFMLTFAGGWPVAEPFIVVTRYISVAYFSYFYLLALCRKLWDYIIF